MIKAAASTDMAGPNADPWLDLLAFVSAVARETW
jgi:hypothetical protein